MDSARRERGTALRVVAAVVALLPWSWLARAGALLGAFVGGVLRIRRRAVVGALQRASTAAPDRVTRAMYASLGAGLLELLWLAGSSARRRDDVLASRVTLDPELDAALQAAMARGPVILAASHTGNWELCAYGAARVLAVRGKRLAAVAKPLSVGVFHDFCAELRRACGLVVLEPRGALTAARALLAAGDVVAMPIDQVPDRARHGVEVSFLGAPALADRAPAALARATGATLLVVAATRDDGVQRVHLLASLEPPLVLAKRSAWVTTATEQATAALDGFVRAHPSSWLWLHRRWRAPLEQGSMEAHAPAGRLVATGHPG